MPKHQHAFLKWPGGKYRLLAELLPRLPKQTCLYEPFVGAGVLLFNTEYEQYEINDLNKDLINVYTLLKKEGHAWIDAARAFFIAHNNQANRYYDFRAEFNACTDLHRRSLLFLYLNRHGYNGLCRYNSQGIFNVPFGRYVQPFFPEIALKCFVAKASRVQIHCLDFREFFKKIPKKSVIYCDPPYAPLPNQASFQHYYVGGFDWQAQEDLALAANKAQNKGCYVLISNHDTPHTRALYANARLHTLLVQRDIGAQVKNRNKVSELLAEYHIK